MRSEIVKRRSVCYSFDVKKPIQPVLEFQPPAQIPYEYTTDRYKSIFLAGSIEQNTATDWQRRVCGMFKGYRDVVIFNPRRTAWDSSWKNVASNPKFREQVEWEIEALTKTDIILMYFDPNTKSPISLLEAGLFAHYGDMMKVNGRVERVSKLHVVCPPKFWRKGNVDIVCEHFNIRQYPNLTQAVNGIKNIYKLK